MTDEQIQKAFEGRWRIKSEACPVAFVKEVKALCIDFFRAGILLAGCSVCGDSIATTDKPDFDLWWNLYDKKRGREKCLQKWQRLTESDRCACINATPDYVASTPDKQFRKDPLTYLNQKAWNDEIINRNANTQPTVQQQRVDKLADILAD